MTILDGGSASGLPVTSGTFDTLEDIVLYVQSQLKDETGVQYDSNKILRYINLAFIEIVKIDPTSYPVTEDFTLVAGANQTLSSDQIAIIDVVCNVTGTVEGTAVTVIPRQIIDQLIPLWRSFTANATVQHVIKEDNDKSKFYVFPPQPVGTTQKLRMIFSEIPAIVDEVDDDFPFDDSYKLPCINYVLYLILREETTVPNSLNKANMCLAQFMRQMGVSAPNVLTQVQSQR